jgi:hypothetical protein
MGWKPVLPGPVGPYPLPKPLPQSHKLVAQAFQPLQNIGRALPANSGTYREQN